METNIVAALTLGFLLGLKHALDPDHLIAVSAIVSEHRSIFRSSLVGTFWGLGHTASLLAVGLVVVSFKTSIPRPAALWMEMAVAAMLALLGVNLIRQTASERGLRVHTHEHSHDGSLPHKHIHLHRRDDHDHRHALIRIGRRPFIVGMVHGLAGSAALTLAALTTIQSVALGLTYLAVFGLGSIGGMLMMSAVISLPFIITARRFRVINGLIKVLAGMFSLLFGLALAWNLLGEIWPVNS